MNNFFVPRMRNEIQRPYRPLIACHHVQLVTARISQLDWLFVPRLSDSENNSNFEQLTTSVDTLDILLRIFSSEQAIARLTFKT